MKKRHHVSSALYGVAAIQALVGVIGWAIYAPRFTIADWVLTLSFLIFLVLAILARSLPRMSAVIAGTLYASFLLLQACTSVELLFRGMIFKVPIVLLLIIALTFAFKKNVDQNLPKKHEVQ